MKTVPLESVATFVRGVTFKPADKSTTGVAVMRTSNVQERLDLSDVIRIPAELVKRDDQYLRHGDTLISSANSWYAVGRACWVPEPSEPMAIGGFITALRTTSTDVDAKYLYRWFTTPSTQATLRSFSNQTTNIANLNLRLASKMPVPIPSLNEQRRIAAILDHANALRAKRRQVLAHLDALPQAIFHEVFGSQEWPRLPLVDLCEGPGKYGAKVPSIEADPQRPRYVRITDITERGMLNDDVRSPGGPEDGWSKHELSDGDLLFARSGATVGKTYRYRDEDGPCVYAGYLIRFRPRRELVHPDFLMAYTGTAEYQAWVSARQNVVAQPNINAKQYGTELLIAVPPMHAQTDYVRMVDAIRSRASTVRRALRADDELFASLQSRAFRGEL